MKEIRRAPTFAGVPKAVVRTALWFCASNLLVAVLAAQCSNPTQVPNQTISSGTATFSNSNALAASYVTINGSASITFVTGNCIDLQPGFHATAGTAGTTFHAWVEAAPAVVSVSPPSGSGLSQAFTWTVSDPSGYADLAQVQAIFNTIPSGQNACYIIYNRNSNLLYLVDNSGYWLGGFTPGSGGSASNPQCSIYGSGSSVNGSGPQLAVTVSVTFQPSFAGPKNNYLIAWDQAGIVTELQWMGTWTVPAPQQYYLTTAVSPSGGGTISPTSGWYNSGAQVSVSAAPAAGYTFAGFSGNLAGTALPQILVMNGNKSVTANFTATPPGQYSLTTSVNAAGAGTITPGAGSYYSGSPVQVTAAANSGYQFTSFTGVDSSNGTIGYVTMNANRSVTANFAAGQYTANSAAELSACTQNPQYGTCTLATGTHYVTSPILINRSNVTLTGGSSDRAQTKLVRDPTFTDPIIRVDAPTPGNCVSGNPASCGITIQNLTVCGSGTLAPSNSGCPRAPTTCGVMEARITQNWPAKPPPPYPIPGVEDYHCTDVEVARADTGLNTTNPDPFSYTGPYSVKIANVDLEDGTAHALSLYASATEGKKVNDVYIHDSAINSSAVTGILVGVNGENYSDHRACDTRANFQNDLALYVPRNIRIEGNILFKDNLTGALGINAARWFALRNNTFTNNYIQPRGGNGAGGTVFFDHCTDKVEIRKNTFTGPTYVATDGLELWGRNIDVGADDPLQRNTVSNYQSDGIGLNSVLGANIKNNTTSNNGGGDPGQTGGIHVWTREPGAACEPLQRETQSVTISGNTSEQQTYGVYLGERETSTNIINTIAVSNSGAVFRDAYVTAIGTVSGLPAPEPPREGQFPPRALPVNPISPVWSKCSATANASEVFTFAATDVNVERGAGNIAWLQGIFSIAGDDSNGSLGPDNGAQGCLFIYYPPEDTSSCTASSGCGALWLAGDLGGIGWVAESPSIVGPGGHDLANSYCRIRAGSPDSRVTFDGKVLKLKLDIQFMSSTKRHMYTTTGNRQGFTNAGDGTSYYPWRYSGWWKWTQP